MDGNLATIELPCGGRAFVRRRLTHEQDAAREAAFLDYWDSLPDEVIAAMAEREQATPEEVVAAARRTRGYGAVVRATDRMKSAVIVAYLSGWEDVTDPDGRPLAFDGTVGSLSLTSDDFDALYDGCLSAATSADPNAGGRPSETPSSAESPTPDGRPD